MSARNECVQYALRELERFGIEGKTETRGSGHIAVNWSYPDGRQRSSMMAATPSDHRAPLNVRGEVRRQLRADGIQLPPPENVLSFKHAISLPKPVEPPNERLRRLEEDLAVMLDWMVDLREAGEVIQKENEALKVRLVGMQVTVTFGDGSQQQMAIAPAPVAQTLVAPVAVFQPWCRKGGPSEKILTFLAGRGWASLEELREGTGVAERSLSATLFYLKKQRGLVENGLRGMWRKVPELQQTG